MLRPRKLALILSVFLCVLIVACKEDDSGPTLAHTFTGNYEIDDYTLSIESQYWEIRIGFPEYDEYPHEVSSEAEYEVIKSVDAETYSTLSTIQLDVLQATTSEHGFYWTCLPEACPVYAVSMDGDYATLIDSDEELLDFFGEIDTEAELYDCLDYSDYKTFVSPVSWETDGENYIAIVDWSNGCGLQGTDLIHVSRKGEINKIRTLTESTTEYCI